jgi:hypothetical protein
MKMRYRIEDTYGCLLVRHVETDRVVGAAFERLCYMDGKIFDICETFNNTGQMVASASNATVRNPLTTPAVALAYHVDPADVKSAEPNAQADRVEQRLGNLIADTAFAFARGFCEAAGPGLTPKTRDQFAASLAELASLCRISRAGCYNATARTHEPYFANPAPSGPRLAFPYAAQVYGMRELRARRPDLNDAERQKLLGWVLRWVADGLSRAEQEIKEEKKRLAA